MRAPRRALSISYRVARSDPTGRPVHAVASLAPCSLERWVQRVPCSAAGPVGTVAGMVVGAMAGALTGHVLEDEGRRARTHDEELDEAIGVTGGDLGAARADAPPARIGTPSIASCGVAIAGEPSPAEGPIQDIDQDG